MWWPPPLTWPPALSSNEFDLSYCSSNLLFSFSYRISTYLIYLVFMSLTLQELSLPELISMKTTVQYSPIQSVASTVDFVALPAKTITHEINMASIKLIALYCVQLITLGVYPRLYTKAHSTHRVSAKQIGNLCVLREARGINTHYECRMGNGNR